MLRTVLRTATVVAVVAPLSLAGLASSYGGQATDTVTCEGEQLTLRVNQSNSSDKGGWSAVQVEGGGHLIPLSFTGTLTDHTINQVIYSFTGPKGGGHPNRAGAITCNLHFDATLGEILEPTDEVPAGAALTDAVSFDIDALVIRKG
jgi:hypothetical protein